jgi:putative sterol carrier protein
MTDQGFAAVDPQAFARNVGAASDEQLAAGMSGDMRGQILDEVFGRIEAHFRADKAQQVEATIRFKITGRADGEADRYEAVIDKGTCRLAKDLVERPDVTITVDAATFLKLITGNANGPELFLRRKLKVKGDLALAARLTGLFALPRSGD